MPGVSFYNLPAVQQPILDVFPNAVLGFALNRLTDDYTGPAINVRRASDNEELQIGFDSDGELDEAALAAFCSGTDGYVQRWYEQINQYNVEQNIAARQPKIYDSSTGVLKLNGKPAIYPDGIDDVFLTFQTITYQSIFIAGKPATSSANNELLAIGLYLAIESNRVVYRTNTFNQHDFPSNSNQQIVSVIATGTTNPRAVNAYRNGIASADNPLSLNIGIDNELRIFGSASVGEYDSPIQTIIVYDSDQSANRVGIETMLNNRYKIY